MEARNNMVKTQNETLINAMGKKNATALAGSGKTTNVYRDCNHEDAFVNRENEKNKKKYFVIIPSEVLCDNNLIPSAKLLYGDITALCNKEGYCWAWNSYFASKYQVLERTIQRWINNLIDNGYIERDIEYFDDSKQISRRLLKVKLFDNGIESIDMRGSDKKDTRGSDKKDIHNNINYNNTNYNKLSKKETHAREKNFEMKNLGKESEKVKDLEETNKELEESNKKLRETNKELREELKELRKYDKSMEKFLNKLDKLEQEEEIKKNPVDSYDVGDKTHSSYSENYVNKTPKIPDAGRLECPDHNFEGDKKPFKSCRPSFNQLIEEYTDNEELQFELKQHLKVKKIKGVLCNHSIELGFKSLDQYAKTDMEKILIVRNANEGGWTKFYELPKWQKPREHADREVSYDIDKYANTYI